MFPRNPRQWSVEYRAGGVWAESNLRIVSLLLPDSNSGSLIGLIPFSAISVHPSVATRHLSTLNGFFRKSTWLPQNFSSCSSVTSPSLLLRFLACNSSCYFALLLHASGNLCSASCILRILDSCVNMSTMTSCMIASRFHDVLHCGWK